MWTEGLAGWYRSHGRHELPWRRTRDPWPILVSEVMLQQTQVSRVIPRWQRFIERWPAPESLANTPLKEVLLEWQGLGYPRRARALWQSASLIARSGWPRDEAGLLRLPGVGLYTARAMLALAFEVKADPPLDVNIARAAARAAVGTEPAQARPSALEHAIASSRPRNLSRRDYTFALFDVGAIHCRRVPTCDTCPLRRNCASRTRLQLRPPAPVRRQSAYAGSMRQLRGALLEASLRQPAPFGYDAAVAAARTLHPVHAPAMVDRALQSLIADGLIAGIGPAPRG